MNSIKEEAMSSLSLELKKCFDLLEQGENVINVNQKNAIFVWGNTGSGKTTLVQFLTTDNSNLVAEEAASDIGDYVIVDKKDKISTNSTIVSKTIFPDLSIDMENNLALYDCPGFVDTRGVAIDIAGTYFIHKLINSVERVKILLTVNYTSIRKGVDRGDFLEMIRYVLSLVKNSDKYLDGVALVVTKVDNLYTKNKITKQRELVPDKVIREYVVSFLQMFKTSVTMITDKTFSSRAVKLVDALLTKNGTNYVRIGLFRRPDEEGPLSKSELLQGGKHYIRTMLMESIQFVRVIPHDFGYAISDQSKNEVKDMIDTINETIKTQILQICADVEEHIANRHAQVTDILEFEKFLVTIQKQVEMFKETVEFEISLKNFVQKFLNLIADLRVNTSRNSFLDMLKQEKYLDFLELVSQRKRVSSNSKWKEGFHRITDYLREMREWYTFLNTLYNHLSSYEVQKLKHKFQYLMERQITSFDDDKWKQFIKSQPDFNATNRWQVVELDNSKVISLNNIIAATLNTSMHVEYDQNLSTRNIYGDFIILSQIKDDDLLNSEVTTILASSKIFIDKNITRSNQRLTNFAMIAPTWEIIEIENIVLDGEDGPSLPIVGQTYELAGDDGYDGQPGLPGKSGANFFGIFNQIINSESLLISTNGGQGGPGQNGGDGFPGLDGQTPLRHKSDGTCEVGLLDWFSWSYKYGLINRKYCSYGENGGDGGNGGNGGIGGLGGYPGNVILIPLNNHKSLTLVRRKHGSNGVGGAGGKAGTGGKAGKSINTKGVLWWWEPIDCEEADRPPTEAGACSAEDHLRHGKNGYDGYSATIKEPRNIPEPMKRADNAIILKKYKEFVRQRLMLDNVYRRKKVDLLKALNENTSLTEVLSTMDLVSEFISLEKDYMNLIRDFDWSFQYEQLLRIVEVHLTSSFDGEELVLKSLQKSIISKLCLLKVQPQRTLITQISEYLDSVNVELSQFQRGEGLLVLNDIHEKLKQELIKTIGEIGDRFSQNRDQISIMIIAICKNIKQTLVDMVNDPQNKNTEERQIMLEQNLILLKIVHAIRETNQFLGTMGNFAGEIVNAARLPNKYSIQNGNYTETVSRIRSILAQLCQFETNTLQEQLGRVSSRVQGDEKVPSAVKNAFERFQNESKNGHTLDEALQMKEILRNLRVQMAMAEVYRLENDQKTLQIIKIILHLNDFGILQSVEGVAAIDDCAKILSATIRSSIAYDYIQFYADKLRSASDQLVGHLSQYLHDEVVDVGRHSKRQTFDDISALLQQLQSSVKLPEMVVSILQQMRLNANVIAMMYDSLSYYQELDRLIAAMKHTPAANLSQHTTTEQQQAVDCLQVMTESNLVSQRFQVMLQNMKQVVFPFGKMYVDAYDLYGNTAVTTANVTNFVLHRIHSMRSDIDKQGPYLDTDHDKLVFDGDFVNRKDHTSEAFYVWRNEEHRVAIERLLAGEQVTLKADVANGVRKDAVKFSVIRVRFASRNELLQLRLDDDLRGFEMEMVHGGDSYYRCGNRFYSFTFDRQTLIFHYGTKADGEPVYKNSSYSKTKNGATILSPYTHWSVRLRGDNFDKLAPYKKWIDLELEGEGQWTRSDQQICDNAQQPYYTPDDTVLETNAVASELVDLSDMQLRPENADPVNATTRQRDRRSPRVRPVGVEHPPATVSATPTKPLLEYANANHRIATEKGGRGEQIDFWSPVGPHSLDRSLLLLDLLVRRVTGRKPLYLAPCPTDFSNVRFCALDIVRHFESVVDKVSDYPGQFDFDPVPLMEQLENDIIRASGKNVAEILLKAVRNNDSQSSDEFHSHLLEAGIINKYSSLQEIS